MIHYLLIFALTFAVGAVLAVALRTANHQPYAVTPPAPAPAPTMLTPTPAPTSAPTSAPTTTVTNTVNTICPGCGDAINPTLPVASYKGHHIGFGCAMCPPKFAADPVKYGEAALKNVVAD